MEALVLLSFGSEDEQTGQLQPTIGTPVDVPQPRIMIFMWFPQFSCRQKYHDCPFQARGLSLRADGFAGSI
jgi:hypothetical protein